MTEKLMDTVHGTMLKKWCVVLRENYEAAITQ